MNKQNCDIIQWIGDQGEFKLLKPNKVASLWGETKGSSRMNYDKFSRGLRYYYGGGMLNKVDQKQHTYKFVCDLEMLVGFTVKELSDMFNGVPR